MLVAIGLLIFLTADAGDNPSPPQSTPSRRLRRRLLHPALPARRPPSATPAFRPRATSPFVVPDLRGLSAPDAATALERSGLRLAKPSGAEGVVAAQDPPPGTGVPVGTPVALVLRPAVTPETAAAATDQSLIGQITALVGALTGLILAVTGLMKILRTRGTQENTQEE
jgi:hypothetical protein